MPVNLRVFALELKLEPINTSCCCWRCCLLLWAVGEGDQGMEEPCKGKLENEIRGASPQLLCWQQGCTACCRLDKWWREWRGACAQQWPAGPEEHLGGLNWQGHLGLAGLGQGMAARQRGALSLPAPCCRGLAEHSFTRPALKMMVLKRLCYCRWHDRVNKSIHWDESVRFQEFLTRTILTKTMFKKKEIKSLTSACEMFGLFSSFSREKHEKRKVGTEAFLRANISNSATNLQHCCK